MAKSEFTIEVKVSENEMKQIVMELGGREPTEENLDKYSRTWRSILERVGEQIVKTEPQKSEDKECVIGCENCKYCREEDEYEYWCYGFCSPARLVRKDDFCSHFTEKR